MHFIDNVAAEYALVNGSSSRRIQKLNVAPYFDRVASESNPVDGLSRGRREGPWQRIFTAQFPKALDHMLEAELSESDLE